MRKYILCILIAVCTVGCAFALAACAAPSMHNFSSSWFCDEDVHYHGCTDAGCAARADEEEHNWVPVDGKVERAPGCGIPGYGECVCTICGATEKRNIPATGNHRWEYVPGEERPATCVEGFKNKKCRVCGAVEVEIVPPVAEHSWDEWEDDNPDEIGTEGTCHPVCSVCGLQGDPQPHVMGDAPEDVVPIDESKLIDGIEKMPCKNCGHAMEQKTKYAPDVPVYFKLNMRENRSAPKVLDVQNNDSASQNVTFVSLSGEKDDAGDGWIIEFTDLKDRDGNEIDGATFGRLCGGTTSDPKPIQVIVKKSDGQILSDSGTTPTFYSSNNRLVIHASKGQQMVLDVQLVTGSGTEQETIRASRRLIITFD